MTVINIWFAGVSVKNKKHKVRFVSILLSLGATYVIGDMYSANLTSMLARPARGLNIVLQLDEKIRA